MLIPALQELGIEVRAYDPKGMRNAHSKMKSARFFGDAYQATEGVHALVLLTEWTEFKELNFCRIKKAMQRPVIIDFPNLLNKSEVAAIGFEYYGVGIG